MIKVNELQEFIDDGMCTVVEVIEDEEHFRAIPLKIGTKIECRENILDEIQHEPYIQENFKLNVRRLNRWWYSVYFAEKCTHDYEPLIFDDLKFCSHCREKL